MNVLGEPDSSARCSHVSKCTILQGGPIKSGFLWFFGSRFIKIFFITEIFSQKVRFYKVIRRDLRNNFLEHHFLWNNFCYGENPYEPGPKKSQKTTFYWATLYYTTTYNNMSLFNERINKRTRKLDVTSTQKGLV